MPDRVSPRSQPLDLTVYQPLSKPPSSKATRAAAPILSGQPPLSRLPSKPLVVNKRQHGNSSTATSAVARKALKQALPEGRSVSCAPHSLAKSTARTSKTVPRTSVKTVQRKDSLAAANTPSSLKRPTTASKKRASSTDSSRSIELASKERPDRNAPLQTPAHDDSLAPYLLAGNDGDLSPSFSDAASLATPPSHQGDLSPPLRLHTSQGTLSPSDVSVCEDPYEAKEEQWPYPFTTGGYSMAEPSGYSDSLDVDGLNGLFAAHKPLESALSEPSTELDAQKRVVLNPQAIASFPFSAEHPIRKLEFSQVGISDAQLEALAGRLQHSLEVVEFVMCDQISDAGVKSLRCLRRLGNFTLNSCTSVTAEGLTAFLTSDGCRRLSSLCLVNVEVTQQLIEAVFRLGELQHLELSCSEGLSDESFLRLGRLPRLRTLVVSGYSLSPEALTAFETTYPLIKLTSSFHYQQELEQQPQSLTLPTAAATVATSVGVQKPAYQFLKDFVAATLFGDKEFEPNELEYQLDYVLQHPEPWVDAAAAFYAKELKDRSLDFLLPITPENWLAIEQKLQEHRPVSFVFMNHYVALNGSDHPQQVTQFYETALKEREVEYDFPITPDTWLNAEQLLQAAHERPILKVFIDLFIVAGFCETQFSEGVPRNLKDLNDLLLMRGDMRKKIRSLNFDNCQLIHLALPVFYFVFENLQEARFTRNRIHQIPEFFRVGGNKLEKLFLGYNLIDSLPPNFGEDYPSITELHLEHNRLTAVPRLAYKTFQNFILLNLENNQIESMSDEDLEMLSQLPITTMVDLTGNPVCDHPDRLKQYQRKCPQIMVRVPLLPSELQVPVHVT